MLVLVVAVVVEGCLVVVDGFQTDLPQALIYVVYRDGPQSPVRRPSAFDHEADDNVGQVPEVRKIESK